MSVRIKTNGSLPRERRPQDFNGPLSPNGDLGAMFSFDSTYSPQNTMVKHSPYENMPARGSHSPRPQIRTILPANIEQVVEPTTFASAGEDLYHSDKSREQLYIEAKHVLNMVEPYKNNASPPQTVPRKPPRSKHDPTLNVMRPPSQEAGQRVQLGEFQFRNWYCKPTA